MPAKGSPTGHKLDFGAPAKSNTNAPAGSFNGPPQTPNKNGAKGIRKVGTKPPTS